MPVQRSIVQALALSGACAGVAGAIMVFGSESHGLIGEGGAAGFTQNAGFNGIVAALFGGLHPLWTIPASFLFGGMLTGGLAPPAGAAGSGCADRRSERRGGRVRRRQHEAADARKPGR